MRAFPFAWRPFGDDKTVIRGGVGRYVETLLSALITAGWAVEASEVGSYTNSIVNGKAALSFPYAFPANLSQPGVATFEYASGLHYKDPYVTQWNLTIERSLGFGGHALDRHAYLRLAARSFVRCCRDCDVTCSALALVSSSGAR